MFNNGESSLKSTRSARHGPPGHPPQAVKLVKATHEHNHLDAAEQQGSVPGYAMDVLHDVLQFEAAHPPDCLCQAKGLAAFLGGDKVLDWKPACREAT